MGQRSLDPERSTACNSTAPMTRIYLFPTEMFCSMSVHAVTTLRSASSCTTPTRTPPSTVPNIPNAANDSTYYTRMLALPNGQVLFNDGSNQMLVYNSGKTPTRHGPLRSHRSARGPSARPDRQPVRHPACPHLSQGAAYGDDVQDNTNFPLVRSTKKMSKVVTHAERADGARF